MSVAENADLGDLATRYARDRADQFVSAQPSPRWEQEYKAGREEFFAVLERYGLSKDAKPIQVSGTWSPESSMIEEFQDAIDRVGAEEFREQLGKALHDLLCNHDPSDDHYRGEPGGRNRYQRHADALLAKLMPKAVVS